MGFLKYILWLFFPKRCAVCGKIIERNKDLCKNCDDAIERIEKSCLVCGAPLKHCECKRFVYRFKGCVAPFYKGENSMRMLYRFKLHGKLDSTDFLAESIYKKVKEYFRDEKFDIVTAVPMSVFKRIGKGYNHSEVIAKALARKMGIKFEMLLNKKPFCKSQHSRKRDERFENVKGMFTPKGETHYKKVLLVDDIKTTGATLNECTKELLFAGAEEVYCAVAIVSVLGIEKN